MKTNFKLFLVLLFILLFAGRAYAVSPTTSYALSGSLTALNSAGISFFTLSGSSDTITGSNSASGSIAYSTGAFSGSITIDNIVLSASGGSIAYGGNSIVYNDSSDSFTGSIPLSLSQNLTQSAVCSDGSAPTSGTCPSGSYLTCPSGYTLSGGTCSETVTGLFTLSGSGSNIDITGGNSNGAITMTQTETCPTGYTLSNGACISNTNGGTTSTFVCTSNGTNYQNCLSGTAWQNGDTQLCPLGQTQCSQQTSTPNCPSGFTLSGDTCTGTTTQTTTSNPQFNGGSFYNGDGIYGITITGNTVYAYAYGYSSVQQANPFATFSGFSMSGSIDSSYPYLILVGEENIIQGFYITVTCADWGYYLNWGSNAYCPSWSYYETPVGSISVSGASVSGTTGPGTGTATGIYTSGNQMWINGTYSYPNPTPTSPCMTGFYNSGGTCYENGGGKLTFSGVPVTTTVSTTTTPTCPSGYTLTNDQCVSYSCPLSGTPQGSAPGQNYTCVEPSGSSNYYCSPNLCYNDSTNTPVSTTETMPAPQTNNGKVTSSGCSGSIYIFPGQALQCTRDFALGENCCSRAKFLLGGRSCSSNSQILAEAIIYDEQYSPPVPVYSGSGDINTAPITSCSVSSIANGCGQQGEAIYLGDYCSLKLPLIGTCLAQTYVFCKFQGLLATIIQAQGRAQLAGGKNAVSWGSAQSPNCTGFTPTQFQELNFANMNLSEYIAVIKNQVSKTLTTSAISSQIANTTKSIGNEINQLETGGALTGTTP